MRKTVLIPSAWIVAGIMILSFQGKSMEGNNFGETPLIQDTSKESIPRVCQVITSADIAAFSPFTNPLTDTEAVEEMDTHSACLYKFFKPNDYAAIKISFSVLTPEDAKTYYNANVEDHRSMWERDPERILNLGDSANFSYNADEALCDVCGLTVISTRFLVIISMKGQYDNVSREIKKDAAIKIARLLFERLPQLKSYKN